MSQGNRTNHVAGRGFSLVKPRPYSTSAQANTRAWKEMSEAEQLTGRTVDQLDALQQDLKAAFYKRTGLA